MNTRNDTLDSLHELTLLYLDGQATPADVAALQSLLAESPAHRDLFIDLTTRARLLREASTAELVTPNTQRPIPFKPHLSPPRAKVRVPISMFAIRYSTFAAAALFLLAAAAVAIYVFAFNSKPETRNPELDQPVAAVVDATDTVIVNDDLAETGSEHAAGTYSIESGRAELLLHSRVSVKMQGPTRLRIRNPMNAAIEFGSASFRCPTGTEGFTLQLPDGSSIVDLGTAFDVHVDRDGRIILRVTEGSVRCVSAGFAQGVREIAAHQGVVIHDGRAQVVGRAHIAIASYPARPDPYDLSDQGRLDWACWRAEPGSPTSVSGDPSNRKSVEPLIGSMEPVGGGAIRGSAEPGDSLRFDYDDGRFPAQGRSEAGFGLFNSQLGAVGAGVQVAVTLPETRSYQLGVWVTAFRGRASFEARADFESVVDTSFLADATKPGRLYIVRVTPAYPGQTIRLKATLISRENQASHVALAAVALAPSLVADDSATPRPGVAPLAPVERSLRTSPSLSPTPPQAPNEPGE